VGPNPHKDISHSQSLLQVPPKGSRCPIRPPHKHICQRFGNQLWIVMSPVQHSNTVCSCQLGGPRQMLYLLQAGSSAQNGPAAMPGAKHNGRRINAHLQREALAEACTDALQGALCLTCATSNRPISGSYGSLASSTAVSRIQLCSWGLERSSATKLQVCACCNAWLIGRMQAAAHRCTQRPPGQWRQQQQQEQHSPSRSPLTPSAAPAASRH
jgi:hypothetical protein